MALIHEQLSRSDNLARIDFGCYPQELAQGLTHTYRHQDKNISLHVEADTVLLNIDIAVPCGLLVNELVSNALKHAFSNSQNGRVTVKLYRKIADPVQLVVQDDGVGLPNGLDYRQISSLGLKLVHSLTRQLGATLDVISESGTIFCVQFNLAQGQESPEGLRP